MIAVFVMMLMRNARVSVGFRGRFFDTMSH